MNYIGASNSAIKKGEQVNYRVGKLTVFVNISTLILFSIFTLYLTAFHNKLYLIKIEELSVFIPGKLFFKEMMESPGGFLSYAGMFFTQFFYHPWLGSLIFLAFLLLIQFLTVKAFNIPARYFPLSFIPSLALLLALTQLGYLIYILKSPGYAYSNATGVIILLISFWAYRKLKNRKLKVLFSFFFIILFYPLAGFYAVFTLFLSAIYEGVSFMKDKRKYHLPLVLLNLIVIVIIPLCYYWYIYPHIRYPVFYIAALPDFYFTRAEAVLWVPFIALFLFLILAVISSFIRIPFSKYRRVATFLPAALFIVLLFGVCCLTHEDENFRAELGMFHAISEKNWEEAVEISSRIEEEPTRMVVMARNLALRRLHQAGNKMFTYIHGDKPYHSPRPVYPMQIAGKMFYYHYGRVNYCYRWCMEDMVEYGMKVEYLKYFVKCALINKEVALAQKYNDVLKKTLFHKSWAKKYQTYIDNPGSFASDPEYKTIMPLHSSGNVLGTDNSSLEEYLLKCFVSVSSSPAELLEYSIQTVLEFKNIDFFWPRFFAFANLNKHIPVHYQEAALLYSHIGDKVDISHINFDKQVISEFNELLKLLDETASLSEEEAKPIFHERFGDTYWYYFIFKIP